MYSESLVLSIQPDDTHIAAGMTDGTLSVRRRQPKASENAASSSDPFSVESLRSGTFESFLDGALSTIGQGRQRNTGKVKARPIGDINEIKVERRRKKKLREYDRLLKNFKYSAALDCVLRRVSSDHGCRSTGLACIVLMKMTYSFHSNMLILTARSSDNGILANTRVDTQRRTPPSIGRQRRRLTRTGFEVAGQVRHRSEVRRVDMQHRRHRHRYECFHFSFNRSYSHPLCAIRDVLLRIRPITAH